MQHGFVHKLIKYIIYLRNKMQISTDSMGGYYL